MASELLVGRDALLHLAMFAQSDVPTGTCFECRDEFELPGYNNDVCSEECYYRHKGEKAENILRNDHRLCTCGRQLKEVNPPSQEWQETKQSALETVLEHGGEYHNVDNQLTLDATEASDRRPTNTDCVIGFQHRTQHAETVEKEFEVGDYHRTYATGTGCECGITDTRDIDEDLRATELATVLANFVYLFRELYHEGQLDQRINKDIFFREYKRSQDITYALGKALHE